MKRKKLYKRLIDNGLKKERARIRDLADFSIDLEKDSRLSIDALGSLQT